ncbi:hypothetical protein C8Q77DRAFT_1068692 [Trametes polyzona]|nr:hypothetical protein C8Q77DRAFT_1068692 [Trametes polyzona]
MSTITLTETETPHPLLNENVLRLYADMEASLHKRLEEPLTDTSLLDKTFREALEQASGKVIENVQGLTTAVREIKVAFKEIGLALHAYDLAAASKADNGVKPQLLRPQWTTFEKTFNDLLNLSHKNARGAINILEDYNLVFPEKVEIQTAERFEEVKVEVRNLITSIDADSDKAYEIEQSFMSLATNLREFEITIEHAVKISSERVSKDLEETRQKIASLSLKLAQVKTEMRDAGLACIATLSAGAISAAYLFFTLSPTSAQTLVASVLAAVPLAIQYKDKAADSKKLKAALQESKHKLSELTKQDELLHKYQAALGGTKRDIEDMCCKIETIAGVWQALKADFQLLDSELTKALGPGIKFTKLVNSKIEKSRQVYVKLKELLEAYVAGVHGEVGGATGNAR